MASHQSNENLKGHFFTPIALLDQKFSLEKLCNYLMNWMPGKNLIAGYGRRYCGFMIA